MNSFSSSELKLDRQQERAVYELTLKKQRSKKSTMSERQVAAMQQLASELVSQRKDFRELLNYTPGMEHQNALSHHRDHHNQHQLCRCSESTLALAAVAAAAAAAAGSAGPDEPASRHPRTNTNSTGSESSASSSASTSSAASTSSSRSAASLSPSSSSASDIQREQILHITSDQQRKTAADQQTLNANLNQHHLQAREHKRQRPLSPTAEAAIIARHKNPISGGSSFISTTSTNLTSSSAHTTSTSSLMSDETNIKLSQLRLEQLNNELERRLHQYEYLVAQEKAILGAYKINLFTSEGVNNFHLFSLDQRSQYYK